MSDVINQHKKMAMGGNFAKGGSIPSPKGGSQKGPMNFGPPKSGSLPPKSGFSEPPLVKVKRANGVKGV